MKENDYYSGITEEQSEKKGIAQFLLQGQKNAVPLRHLVRLTGHNERMVRKMIQRERLKGIPILHDNLSGYFLPASQDEVISCVRSMKRRAAEIIKVAQSLNRIEVGGYAEIQGGEEL